MSRILFSSAIISLPLLIAACQPDNTASQLDSVTMIDGDKMYLMFYENSEVKFQSCAASDSRKEQLFLDEDHEGLRKGCNESVKAMSLSDLSQKVKLLMAAPDFSRLDSVKSASLKNLQTELASYKKKLQDVTEEIEVLFSDVPDSDAGKMELLEKKKQHMSSVSSLELDVNALQSAVTKAEAGDRSALIELDVKATLAKAASLNLSTSNYALAFTRMIRESATFILNEREHTLLTGVVLSFDESRAAFDPMKWVDFSEALVVTPGTGMPMTSFVANQLDGSTATLSMKTSEGCEWVVGSIVQSALLINGNVPASFKGQTCTVTVTAKGGTQSSSKDLKISGKMPRIEQRPNQCSMKQVTVADHSQAPIKSFTEEMKSIVFEGKDLLASPQACPDYFRETSFAPTITNPELLSNSSPYYATLTNPITLGTEVAPKCEYEMTELACRDAPEGSIGTCSNYTKYWAKYKKVIFTIPSKQETVKVDPACPDTVSVEVYD